AYFLLQNEKPQSLIGALGYTSHRKIKVFSHTIFSSTSSPIQTLTVGSGLTPDQPRCEYLCFVGHGLKQSSCLYRRSGIAPCPEDGIYIILLPIIIHVFVQFAIKIL